MNLVTPWISDALDNRNDTLDAPVDDPTDAHA